MGAVFIGYRGENAVREIKIPVSHLTSEFPGMTVCMSMVPVGGSDDDAYLLDTTLDGDNLIWHVHAADVMASGTTKAAVRLVDGSGRVALDHPFEVFISANIGASGEMPEVYIPWIDRLAAAAARAEEAADGIDGAIADKLDKSGHTPNMFLGTDEDGNVVEKEAPEGGGGGVVEETDPTVPDWAKQPNRPTYTKTDVGLGNVDNVRQYSANNPPPYPVQSVNDKTGAVTLSTGDLENNSGFITKAVSDLANYYLKSETYTREEINQRISQIPKFAISVVSTLPATGDVNTIYLVGGGISGNLYTEYIWADGAWEILGSQRVDLTGYATETWVSGQLGSYLKASELVSAINTALEQAAASGEFDGADGVGVAGVSVTRTPDEYGYYYITVELTDGQVQAIPYRNGADGQPGVPGEPGADGKDGTSVTVTKVTESTADGGSNVVTFSDGKTLTVKNGSKGEKGDTGAAGATGSTGAAGKDGSSVTIKSVSESTVDGGSNVVTFSDGKSVTIKNGSKGNPGSPGHTPVQGVDYFTPEEVEAFTAEVNNNAETFIATELAKRGQIKPEFANSIEECTDTSKMYVLPDGNIYAYMSTTGPTFTDVISTSIGTDGKPYNGGLGYKTGIMLSTSGGELTQANSIATGFIPIKNLDSFVIKLSGKIGALTNNDQMKFYNASFANIQLDNIDRPNIAVEKYGATFDGEPAFGNAVNTFAFSYQAFKSKSGYYSGLLTSGGAAYVRFSLVGYDLSKFVAAVNEDIGYGTSSQWTNTGHAFIPADYEDRIIELEKDSENHEQRIRTLEMYGADSPVGEDIPAYIKTAADEVIAKVISQQGRRSFTLIALSDFHYANYASGTTDNRDNLIRACKAIGYINGRINVDAVATLGDNTPFGAKDTIQERYWKQWFQEVNEILTMTQQPGIVDFRTPGNHDRAGGNDSSGNPTEPIPDNAIFSYITGYNRQCEIGNVPGGWAYKDFDGHKLRVIVLNTSEVEGKGRFSTHSGFHMSTKQYRWFIDTLDLSGKADAADWQILILSHHRADDWQVAAKGDTTYILPNILNAYKNGGSYTGVNAEDNATISCNFAGKNAATLIGQIHGHHHAYIYGYLGLSNGGTQTNVMAISTPTTGFGTGAGHNDDNDGNWYDSIKDTAEETAFCLYSIDLDNHVVNAIHYGNGIDRVIAY